MRTTLASALLLAAAPALAEGDAQTATGSVYHDQNANGVRDAGEAGVQGVLVSNGREVVPTERDGSYELPIDDDTILFVCKPRGWMVPTDGNGLPQHYYLHKPNGSPPLIYGGVAPTGPLPASVDFPLTRQEESERFNVVLFGDPQPYNIEQVDHFARDIVPEVIEAVQRESAAFGITLGDIVGNDLSLFGPHNDVVGAIGLPWINVYGNHDMDFDSPDDEHADETFNRVYGPTTYAFQYANIHFIVIDNVMYSGGTKEKPKGSYEAGLSEKDHRFVMNYFEAVNPPHKTDQRFVFVMHIPATEFELKFRFLFSDEVRYGSIAPRVPLSLAAHWHRQRNYMIQAGTREHHHLVHATTSGSWWQGTKDEYGIPHAMMRDGKPNGWSMLTFDPALERGYEVHFKAAGKPWSEQMHIIAPDVVWAGDRRNAEHEKMLDADDAVVVNLWSGSELSKVEVRYVHAQTGDATAWRSMTTERGVDPHWASVRRQGETGEGPKMSSLSAETDLWVDRLPDALKRGSYTIEVRETNMYGHEHTARRILRVLAPLE